MSILYKVLKPYLERVQVIRSYDIPYLAGYPKDREDIVYIDKDVPDRFTDSKGREVLVDKYLSVHEVLESLLEHHLGFTYQVAHSLAIKAEKAAVEEDGISWKEYSDFMSKWIEKVKTKKICNAPRDLDLQPYVDSKDKKELRKLV